MSISAGLSYSSVRDYMSQAPTRRSRGGGPALLSAGFVPQTHLPGAFPTEREHSVPLTSTLSSRACSARDS